MLLNQGGNGDAAYPLEMSLRFLPSTPLLEMSLRFLPRNGDAAYPLNSSASLRHCVKLRATYSFFQNNSYFNNRHSIGPLYSVNRFAVRSPIDFANFRLPVNR